jgi:hypothetical protein
MPTPRHDTLASSASRAGHPDARRTLFPGLRSAARPGPGSKLRPRRLHAPSPHARPRVRPPGSARPAHWPARVPGGDSLASTLPYPTLARGRTSLPSLRSSSDLARSTYAACCCSRSCFSACCSRFSVSAFLRRARRASAARRRPVTRRAVTRTGTCTAVRAPTSPHMRSRARSACSRTSCKQLSGVAQPPGGPLLSCRRGPITSCLYIFSSLFRNRQPPLWAPCYTVPSENNHGGPVINAGLYISTMCPVACPSGQLCWCAANAQICSHWHSRGGRRAGAR